VIRLFRKILFSTGQKGTVWISSPVSPAAHHLKQSHDTVQADFIHPAQKKKKKVCFHLDQYLPLVIHLLMVLQGKRIEQP